MAEFYQVRGNTWVIETSMMIPVYRINQQDCIFLDSGWEYEGDAIDAVIEENGLKPLGILGSHFHRDHIGNMFRMKKKYGALTALPELEAQAAGSLLLSYALSVPRSFETVRRGHESILGSPDLVIAQDCGRFRFCGADLEIIPATGHSIGQICTLTPDGVIYLADAVLGTQEVSAAKMLHHAFQGRSRETMERIRAGNFAAGIAAHKEIVSDVNGLIDRNLRALDEQCEAVLREVYDEPDRQEILERVVKARKMLTSDPEKAATCERNVMYFINYLLETEQLKIKAREGIRHFYRT